MATPINVTFTASCNLSVGSSGSDILRKVSLSEADNATCLYEAGTRRSILPLENVLLNLNGLTTSKFVYFKADGAFNMRIGADDADPLPVAPISSGQSAVCLVTLSGASAIYIQNPSASTSITLEWAVAGT